MLTVALATAMLIVVAVPNVWPLFAVCGATAAGIASLMIDGRNRVAPPARETDWRTIDIAADAAEFGFDPSPLAEVGVLVRHAAQDCGQKERNWLLTTLVNWELTQSGRHELELHTACILAGAHNPTVRPRLNRAIKILEAQVAA